MFWKKLVDKIGKKPVKRVVTPSLKPKKKVSAQKKAKEAIKPKNKQLKQERKPAKAPAVKKQKPAPETKQAKKAEPKHKKPESFPTKECPFCGSRNVILNQERDELYCSDCGSIYIETVNI